MNTQDVLTEQDLNRLAAHTDGAALTTNKMVEELTRSAAAVLLWKRKPNFKTRNDMLQAIAKLNVIQSQFVMIASDDAITGIERYQKLVYEQLKRKITKK